MAQSHVLMGADAFHAQPTIRRITFADLKDALARGFDDFIAMPSQAVFLCLIYPIAGLLIGSATFGYGLLPLLYPLASGFALLGPFAAIGLYELSRQRERGLEPDLRHAFDIFRLPTLSAIVALGLLLMAIFLLWLAVAQAIYIAHFGYAPITSVSAFIDSLFTTRQGHSLIIVGNIVGFVFALVVLVISVISFPLLVDRDIGVVDAVVTSIRAVAKNPLIMATWGLIVAAGLVIGSLPFLIGLAVVLPVLGHATWHLYRKVVAPDPRFQLEPHRPVSRQHRYAAQFPASLFAGEEERER